MKFSTGGRKEYSLSRRRRQESDNQLFCPPPPTPDTGQKEKVKNATQDLFELLERVQCSRLDDQRCVLPAYFSQRAFESSEPEKGTKSVVTPGQRHSSRSLTTRHATLIGAQHDRQIITQRQRTVLTNSPNSTAHDVSTA
ncbi:unnamed protein product [Bemisia tabaci]|uniref:Uncharacterized protein n=1 Tax=Bemisia tabaci TaxID=7038 RepID=A0A9P0CD70_BEMTA|nr:unnamed protein product [Bemisia tabaci]